MCGIVRNLGVRITLCRCLINNLWFDYAGVKMLGLCNMQLVLFIRENPDDLNSMMSRGTQNYVHVLGFNVFEKS